MIKLSHAANLALGLACFSPILLFFGFFARYAWISPQQIPTYRLIENVLLTLGVFSYSIGLWFAGYSYSAAPRRALCAAVVSLLPLFFLWYLYASVP